MLQGSIYAASVAHLEMLESGILSNWFYGRSNGNLKKARAAYTMDAAAEMTMVPGKTYYFEDLEIGMEASFSKTVTEKDIVAYANISGDFNPVHVDEDYAAQTFFKKRIAHGLLTAGFISAVFGMQLPGPGAIYVSQTMNFKAPVFIDALVVTKVTIVDLIPSKRRALFDCECSVGDRVVLDGEAMLMVPKRPD